jgi:2-polyprenyl-6-methoxyphenol hydroxylase-like FAD-dependent oxidoreductase
MSSLSPYYLLCFALTISPGFSYRLLAVLIALGLLFLAKERIRLSTEVTKIERAETHVTVTTANAIFYPGDLVVGADGLHS